MRQVPRYSILLDTVQSLDGSYQWHSRQMPYPRHAAGVSQSPAERAGYPWRGDPVVTAELAPGVDRDRKGFPFYRTRSLRSTVFATLFPGPFEGEILRRPEFRHPHYPYRPCLGDPFRPAAPAAATSLCEVDD